MELNGRLPPPAGKEARQPPMEQQGHQMVMMARLPWAAVQELMDRGEFPVFKLLLLTPSHTSRSTRPSGSGGGGMDNPSFFSQSLSLIKRCPQVEVGERVVAGATHFQLQARVLVLAVRLPALDSQRLAY